MNRIGGYMSSIVSARVLTEDEQRSIERAWDTSDEKRKLDEQRKRIREAIATKKSCHSH
jgi:hypothetical protein